jgi:hypothetical protein
MSVISRQTRPFLGIQINTILIKIDKLVFFSDVLVALLVLTALTALTVFVALIVLIALIASAVVEIAAIVVAGIAADVVAGDVAAANNSSFRMKNPCMSCRGFSLD